MDDPTASPAGYPVAIGQPRWPTPQGHFTVNEMVENPDFVVFDFKDPEHAKDRGRIAPGITNPLGLRWIGFAYDHGWAIGFHGTQKTEVLGQAVSHGCVRMSNPDVVQVFARIKLGTPVIVEP
jgi:lipoprotein-anchoring transpeptidase ErfK/SrfK